MKRKVWTEQEIEQIKKWQNQDVSGREQARRLGCSYATWRVVVENHKLADNATYSNYDPYIRSFIIDLLTKGRQQKEIAQITGHSNPTVINRIIGELVRDGLLQRVKKGQYVPTKEWTGTDSGKPRSTTPSQYKKKIK